MRRKLAIAGTVGFLALLITGATLLVLDKPGSDNRHRSYLAESEMSEITKALNGYWLSHGQYPSSLIELTADFFPNGVPNDPFTRQPYIYVTNGQRFALISYGHDGEAGQAEFRERDIVFTEAGQLNRARP